MGDAFIIKGGKPIFGTIDVRGSKNAALPVLAATLLTQEKCTIRNLPSVLDVQRMIGALEQIGSRIRWLDTRSVEVENKTINPADLSEDTVRKMRASILLVGPLLARFGKIKRMKYPGGCSIGPRPVDVHLQVFRDLGAHVDKKKHFFSLELPSVRNIPGTLVLHEFSVTATENVLMFLSAFPRRTTVKIAAAEPHVADLARFLSRMGARVRGAGTSNIEILGASVLKGAEHTVVPDYIEAGSFILATLAAGGKVEVRNAPVSHLDLFLKKLTDACANIDVQKSGSVIVTALPRGGLRKDGSRMIIDKIQTLPYPGIPTDLQSAFGVLATQTKGRTLMHEPLYEKRLECLKELRLMGAKVDILDPHRAIVFGPTCLRGAEVRGSDLRSSMALVIAGLAARGTTVVRGAEQLERGYEDVVGRLSKLGADIKRT